MAAAFKSGPLLPTTRENIWWTKEKEDQVFLLRSKKMTDAEVDKSPPSGKTFLLVSPSEEASEILLLKTELDQQTIKVKKLEESMDQILKDKERANDYLYRQLFTSRELAVLSLLVNQSKRLDQAFEEALATQTAELVKNITSRKGKRKIKNSVMKQFADVHNYVQLVRAVEYSSNRMLTEVLERAEDDFIRSCEEDGLQTPEVLNLRDTMKEYFAARKIRNMVSTRIFDYDHREKGKESTSAEAHFVLKAQAKILLDLHNALEKGWLADGLFRSLAAPTGSLALKVARKAKELESSMGLSLKQLAGVREEGNGEQE